jgi:hypothetical protein
MVSIHMTGTIDLRILLRSIQRQLLVAAFDSLKDLDSVTVADTSQLPGLIAQVQTEIDNEKARTALVEKIIGTAKIALKAAGLSIP